jgi:hypothetical protein
MSGQKQQEWNRFLQDTELAKNYQILSKAQRSYQPNPIVDELLPSMLFMRLLSILDESLEQQMDSKSVPLKNGCKADLYGRIESLAEKSYLSAAPLHELRKRRKPLAHDATKRFGGWKELNDAISTVESVLQSFGLVGARPKYEFCVERSQAKESTDSNVAFFWDYSVALKNEEGVKVVEYTWQTKVMRD